MRKKHFKWSLTALVAFISITIATAQTTPVQFMVNMNHQETLGNFNPATQTVDIAGSFNNWGDPTTVLSDDDEDGIYTITVNLEIGTVIQFKTRIDAQWDGTEEFSGGGPNRDYTVQENGIVSYWYNDDIPEGALYPTATASALIVQPAEAVQFFGTSSGEPVSWEWVMPGATPETSTDQNPVATYAESGVYTVTLIVEDAEGNTATISYDSFIRVDPMETHWWNDTVFYEIFVRSFKDSDGDGRGDIQGLISKLDYLNDGNPETTTDLGITGIWLMPIQQSPSYHGYDVSDYMTVEEDYGSNADFTALIEACHERGIKVIIDLVMNHTSTQHPWFVASASSPTNDQRNWYIWEDSNPGTPGPLENYPWAQQNGYWYYNAFWSGMPDLNFNTAGVREAFEDITEFWLTDMNVDGFRLDAVKYLYENDGILEDNPATIAYWQEFRQYYKSVNPEAFAVGEAWTETNKASRYVNNDGLDYVFEFNLAESMINGLNNGNAEDIEEQMLDVVTAYPHLQWGTFLTNHDINRVMSQLESDTPKAKAAATLMLTLPGIPYIYYGEEIGMTGVKPDENLRTPMQWTGTIGADFTTGTPWYSINNDYTTRNVEAQQANSGSLWTLYRDLIALRNNEAVLRRGTYIPVTAANSSIFAFIRQYETENILVVVNMGYEAVGNTALTVQHAGMETGDFDFNSLLDDTILNISIDNNGGFVGFNAGAIPAKGYSIYKLGPNLGINNNEFNNTISLYPNPAKNSFSLSKDVEKIEVYSITGQLVKSYDATPANTPVDINDINKGIYVIKITDSNNTTTTTKLVRE